MTEDLLAYRSAGDGPLILFLHGLTFSARTWDPVVDQLRNRFRCVAVDLPGHGGSTGSGADPAAVCERVHATAVAAGLDQPLLVGHSAGALIATGYAGRYPAAGVVNVDQTVAVARFAGFVQGLEPALRGPDFAAAFAPFRAAIGVDRLPEPERSRVAATQRIDRDVVLDHWTKVLTTPPARLQIEIDDLLEAVKVPYLLLRSDDSGETDRRVLRSHLPSAVVESWPDEGHLLHLAEPRRFADRVARFAEEVAGG
jgi:pimeloyl-ACP methyl ester carboxylesterase